MDEPGGIVIAVARRGWLKLGHLAQCEPLRCFHGSVRSWPFCRIFNDSVQDAVVNA